MAIKRTGILGGTFDPIHLGHLILANDAIDALDLDEVIFVPAAQSPLKGPGPLATAEDRVSMLEAAIDGNVRMSIDTLEIDRGGTSYSIDTAKALKHARPDSILYWLIGGDQAKQLSDWRAIDELQSLVQFVAMDRDSGRFQESETRTQTGTLRLGARRIDISSTEIRNRLSAGLCVKHFLPSAVHDLIKSRKLYAEKPSSELEPCE